MQAFEYASPATVHEAVGLLGPNGAGKTTLVSIVAGLRRPDSGSVSVGGIDVLRAPQRARELIGLAPQDTGVASLGYRLRRAAWGSGYATEGARALVRYAFTSLNVRELVATTMAVNAGSRRVLEKAGLEYRRTVYLEFEDPLEGNEHGDVEYRLLGEDWERRAQPGGVT